MGSPSENCDIAIVGGGPVGLCAALALQHSAQSIRLVEAANLHRPQSGGLNARSIALSYSSVQVFRALGIWPAIERQAAPITDIHVSSQGRWGVTRLRASELELDAMGYVIESRLLVASLLELVSSIGHIELVSEASVETVRSGRTPGMVYRQGGRQFELQSRLLLVADGANSPARRQLGIGHRSVEYGQSAIITNVEFSRPLPGMAYERFTVQGPLAILPLGGKRYACVWTRRPDEAESLMQSDEAGFIAALQHCFGYRMGSIEAIGERYCFELRRIEADQLYKEHCLVIGNAANSLHPVAGQGFNLALRDIAVLHELLGHRPPDSLDEVVLNGLLTEYEAVRQLEQKRVARMGDGLVGLFSNELPLLDHLRAGSLGLLDLATAVKTGVALTGMGMTFGGNAMLRGRL